MIICNCVYPKPIEEIVEYQNIKTKVIICKDCGGDILEEDEVLEEENSIDFSISKSVRANKKIIMKVRNLND